MLKIMRGERGVIPELQGVVDDEMQVDIAVTSNACSLR